MRTSETSEIVKQEIGYTREIIHKQIDSLAEALERTGNREVLCALNTEICRAEDVLIKAVTAL